jgi:hypothetical protein
VWEEDGVGHAFGLGVASEGRDDGGGKAFGGFVWGKTFGEFG